MPTFKPRDFLKSSASFRIYNNIEDNIIDKMYCIVYYIQYIIYCIYASISLPKFGNMWFVWYLTYGVPHHYNESARNRFWFLDKTEHRVALFFVAEKQKFSKKEFWMKIERVGIMKLVVMLSEFIRFIITTPSLWRHFSLCRHYDVIMYYIILAFKFRRMLDAKHCGLLKISHLSVDLYLL